MSLSGVVNFGIQNLINELLHRSNHIDEMTKKWLSQALNPPRIPLFYTLTKIHNPTTDGRPIISGSGGLTERISSFKDYILQPIARSQNSYLKDMKDFINFIEKTKIPQNSFLVSLTKLYTNIRQQEEIETVCKETSKPTHAIKEMLRLILQENCF